MQSACLAVVAALAAPLGAGCEQRQSDPAAADAGGPEAGEPDASSGDAGEAPPPKVCRSGRGWSPGSEAFVDRTTDWGLDNRSDLSFAVVDVDGDGWQDLIALRGRYERDIGSIFLNRPDGDGRRFERDTGGEPAFPARDEPDAGRYMSNVTAGDIDNDGDMDLFVNEFDYPPEGAEPFDDGPDIFLNDGSGAFSFPRGKRIAAQENPKSVGAFFFDHDLDGKLDLAVGYWFGSRRNGQQPQLFVGDGGGRFDDVTADAGMVLGTSFESFLAGTNVRPLFGVAMCDVDDDGRMDIVGSAYGRYYNELFVAGDEGKYEEDALARGVAADELMDYTTDDSYRCYCESQVDEPYCEGAEPPENRRICTAFGGTYGRGWEPGVSDQPVSLGGNTCTHVCADFDNDGDLDLYETNIKHPDTGTASDPSELLVNDGTGHYTRPGRDTMGLTPPIDTSQIDEGGHQGAAPDFDNDGWLDILLAGSSYPSNRSWLFRQGSPLQFESVGADAGLDHWCPAGMALADFDHDGDEDVIVGTSGCADPAAPDGAEPPTRLYENVSNDANWVSIRLVGLGGAGHANRSGLGGRVRLTAGGITQTRLIHGTWGQGGMSREQVAFFGLGEACDIERIEVRWPNAALSTQSFTNVRANYRVELREDDPQPQYLP